MSSTEIVNSKLWCTRNVLEPLQHAPRQSHTTYRVRAPYRACTFIHSLNAAPPRMWLTCPTRKGRWEAAHTWQEEKAQKPDRSNLDSDSQSGEVPVDGPDKAVLTKTVQYWLKKHVPVPYTWTSWTSVQRRAGPVHDNGCARWNVLSRVTLQTVPFEHARCLGVSGSRQLFNHPFRSSHLKKKTNKVCLLHPCRARLPNKNCPRTQYILYHNVYKGPRTCTFQTRGTFHATCFGRFKTLLSFHALAECAMGVTTLLSNKQGHSLW